MLVRERRSECHILSQGPGRQTLARMRRRGFVQRVSELFLREHVIAQAEEPDAIML